MSVDNAFKWQTLRWQYYYISIPNGYMGEKNVPFYIRKHLNILPKKSSIEKNFQGTIIFYGTRIDRVNDNQSSLHCDA